MTSRIRIAACALAVLAASFVGVGAVSDRAGADPVTWDAFVRCGNLGYLDLVPSYADDPRGTDIQNVEARLWRYPDWDCYHLVVVEYAARGGRIVYAEDIPAGLFPQEINAEIEARPHDYVWIYKRFHDWCAIGGCYRIRIL